jgi:hypothetical protein
VVVECKPENVDNLNSVRRETSRTFRKKEGNYVLKN